MNTQISIIIPAYNASAHLPSTLESVRAQTEPRWELIVVDDGSVDDTAEIASAYAQSDSRIRVIRQHNGGVSLARMVGFSETRTDAPYVTFLDADDVWEPTALAVLSAAAASAPTAVGAHGLARFIDEHGELLDPGDAEGYGRERFAVLDSRIVPLPLDAPTTFSALVVRNCIFTSGQVILRRENLVLSGGYSVELGTAEDWDLWLRLTSRGPLAFVDEVVLGYRRHRAAMSNNQRAMAQGARRVRRNLMTSSYLTDEQRSLARTAFRLERLDSVRRNWSYARDSVSRGRVWSAVNHVRRAIAAGLEASVSRMQAGELPASG